MDDLLADFLTETNESLADLDVALVKLERTPDDGETLSLIFRLVHTIKGTCGFLGLPRLEQVAHAGENVLGKLRDGVLTVTPDIVSLVLTALDRIKAILAGLAATGSEPAGDDSALIDALNATAAGEAPPQRRARRLRRSRSPKPPPVRQPPPEPPRRGSRTAPPPLPSRQPPPPAPRAAPAGRAARASRSPPRRPSGSPSTCWKT